MKGFKKVGPDPDSYRDEHPVHQCIKKVPYKIVKDLKKRRRHTLPH